MLLSYCSKMETAKKNRHSMDLHSRVPFLSYCSKWERLKARDSMDLHS